MRSYIVALIIMVAVGVIAAARVLRTIRSPRGIYHRRLGSARRDAEATFSKAMDTAERIGMDKYDEGLEFEPRAVMEKGIEIAREGMRDDGA